MSIGKTDADLASIAVIQDKVALADCLVLLFYFWYII